MKTPSIYTASGNKAATVIKLPSTIFDVSSSDHTLLKNVYDAYLANSRANLAVTKKRGEVRGGGKKPWKQKGTGRARFGSIRVPIWRGGGIVFGPTGNENYTKHISKIAKKTALRQALSVVLAAGKIKIITQSAGLLKGKTKDFVTFLNKIDAKGMILYVVDKPEALEKYAAQNIQNVRVVNVQYLTTYDVLNADTLLLSENSIAHLTDWLGLPKSDVGAATKKSKKTEVTK